MRIDGGLRTIFVMAAFFGALVGCSATSTATSGGGGGSGASGSGSASDTTVIEQNQSSMSSSGAASGSSSGSVHRLVLPATVARKVRSRLSGLTHSACASICVGVRKRSRRSMPLADTSISGYWKRRRTEEGWRAEKPEWKRQVEADLHAGAA